MGEPLKGPLSTDAQGPPSPIGPMNDSKFLVTKDLLRHLIRGLREPVLLVIILSLEFRNHRLLLDCPNQSASSLEWRKDTIKGETWNQVFSTSASNARFS